MSMFTQRTTHARNELKREIDKQKQRLNALKHPLVKETWEMFPLKERRNVSLALSSFSDTVHFSLHLQKLESFKDKRLVKILESFATPAWKAFTNDWTGGEEPNRDYRFDRVTPYGFNICVMLFTYVKSDSPTCRIVIKEIKEEVVRKEERVIVCD